MSFLYERVETDQEITIVYKNFALYYFLLLGAVILSFVELFEVIWPIVFVAAVVFIFGYWKPNKELRAAMKEGRVAVSGSKLSFKNPFKAVITKPGKQDQVQL